MTGTLDLLWPVLVPIAIAALTACCWRSPRLQRELGLLGLVVLFGVSLRLLWRVLEDGVVAKQFGSWPAPFGTGFVADPLSAALTAVTGCSASRLGSSPLPRSPSAWSGRASTRSSTACSQA